MILHINHETTIKELQEKFRKAYPFLKIEFADRSQQPGEVKKPCHWYDPVFRLQNIAKLPRNGEITLHPWSKTGDVEDMFSSMFGVYAQIFRNQGGSWIQTAGTDVLTLDEQNEIGVKDQVL